MIYKTIHQNEGKFQLLLWWRLKVLFPDNIYTTLSCVCLNFPQLVENFAFIYSKI